MTINAEKIQELAQKARENNKTGEFQELVNRFEDFALLFIQKEERQKDPLFMMGLDSAYQAFWGAFGNVVQSMNLTPAQMKEYFEDPSRFPLDEWEQIQAIRRDVDAAGSNKDTSKKLKRTKNKVRI